MAALHFLLPTGHSQSGRRSLIPNSSPFSRSTRFPFTYRFAARAPCDSKDSEWAAKEKPTPISHIFFSTCCAWSGNESKFARPMESGRNEDRKGGRKEKADANLTIFLSNCRARTAAAVLRFADHRPRPSRRSYF